MWLKTFFISFIALVVLFTGCATPVEDYISEMISTDKYVRGAAIPKYKALLKRIEDNAATDEDIELYAEIQKQLKYFLGHTLPSAPIQREYATVLIDDQNFLRYLVRNDKSSKIRMLALRRLIGFGVVSAELQRLLADVLKTKKDPNFEVRKEAVKAIYKQDDLLAFVAENDEHAEVRLAAVQRMKASSKTEAVYYEIALNSASITDRITATAKLTNVENLKKVYEANDSMANNAVRLAVVKNPAMTDATVYASWYESDPSYEVRASLITKIKNLEKLYEYLRNATSSEHPGIKRQYDHVIAETLKVEAPKDGAELNNLAWITQNVAEDEKDRLAIGILITYQNDLEKKLALNATKSNQDLIAKYDANTQIIEKAILHGATLKTRVAAVGIGRNRHTLNTIIGNRKEAHQLIEEARKRRDAIDSKTIRDAKPSIECLETLLIIVNDEYQGDAMKMRARDKFQSLVKTIVDEAKDVNALVWIIRNSKVPPKNRLNAIAKIQSCDILRDLINSKTLAPEIHKTASQRLEDCYCEMLRSGRIKEDELVSLIQHWKSGTCTRIEEVKNLVTRLISRDVLKKIEGCDKLREASRKARQALEKKMLKNPSTSYEEVMAILQEKNITKELRDLAENHVAIKNVIASAKDQKHLADIVIYSTKNAKPAMDKLTSVAELIRVAYLRDPMNGYLRREILKKTQGKTIQFSESSKLYTILDVKNWSDGEEKITERNQIQFIYKTNDKTLRIKGL